MMEYAPYIVYAVYAIMALTSVVVVAKHLRPKKGMEHVKRPVINIRPKWTGRDVVAGCLVDAFPEVSPVSMIQIDSFINKLASQGLEIRSKQL